MMVINYVREQTNLGLIKIDKIAGTKNNADLLTKKLRDGTFLPKRNALLGLPESNLRQDNIVYYIFVHILQLIHMMLRPWRVCLANTRKSPHTERAGVDRPQLSPHGQDGL